MLAKKKGLLLVVTIVLSLLLAACGGNEKSEQASNNNTIRDNPRNHTAEDFMPISEGFEEFSIWIESEENPVRDSKIKNIYVFDKDEVTLYPVDGSYVIEDILELSDEDLKKLAQETATEFYTSLEEEVKNNKLFDLEAFNETRLAYPSIHGGENEDPDLQQMLDAYFQEIPLMNEDIHYDIEGNWSEQSSPYNLDIQMDDLGQHTQEIELTIPSAEFKLTKTAETHLFGDYIDYLFFNMDAISFKMDAEELFNEDANSFVTVLQEQGHFEDKAGFELGHPHTFVPKPYVWEAEDTNLTLQSVSLNQKIFDTTFAGVKAGSGSLLTRVDDSFVGFRLDDSDTEKDNVTIEGK